MSVFVECCRALVATPPRLLRPRPVDHAFLASLVDAGVPAARTEVRLTALTQSTRRAPAAVIAEGTFRPPTVSMAMSSFLVEHPSSRIVIDPALCADVGERVLPELPAPLRATVRPHGRVRGLGEVLDDVGLGPGDVDLAIATHLHWDHVSGLAELPSRELVITRTERDHVFGPARAPATYSRTPLAGHAIDARELDGPPVLTFPASHDVFGDGSVVLVDLAGHTPGSVGVLLAVTGGRRVLLAGDAVWSALQVRRLRQKAPFPGAVVDDDRDATHRSVHRLHALPPGIELLPAHDGTAARAFAPA